MTELEKLLHEGPTAIERVFDEAPRPLTSQPIHWHGVAEGSAFRALRAFDDDERPIALAWSKLAIRVYEALEASTGHSSFGHSAMLARLNAIRRAGASDGDWIRDPAIIVNWFLKGLERTVESACEAAALPLAEQSLAELRRLREIKNRLNVLRELAAVVPVGSEVERWLAIRERLP